MSQQFISLTDDQLTPHDEGQQSHVHARRGSTHEPLGSGTTPTQEELPKIVESDTVKASNDRLTTSEPKVDRLV